MKLLTKKIKKQLPALYFQDKKGYDETVYLKLFVIFGSLIFYITEFDQKDTFFGYTLNGDTQEFGYFSLSEFESLDINIQRDIFFQPKKLRDCWGVICKF